LNHFSDNRLPDICLGVVADGGSVTHHALGEVLYASESCQFNCLSRRKLTVQVESLIGTCTVCALIVQAVADHQRQKSGHQSVFLAWEFNMVFNDTSQPSAIVDA
jgi:hypothetical protein